MLTKIDFLGYTPKLYFNNKERYKSRLGGFLGIVLAILTIFATFYYSREMY